MTRLIRNWVRENWLVCRITSSRESAKNGLRFSTPIFVLLVVLGVITTNLYVLFLTSVISFLGIIFPMHPFDYLYNFFAKSFGVEKIAGRGTELQVSSTMAFLFNVVVLVMLAYEVRLNYVVLAAIYVLNSIFFVGVLLFMDNFSFYSMRKPSGKAKK